MAAGQELDHSTDLWLDQPQLVVMNDNIFSSEFALDIRSVGYCSSVNTKVAVIQHLKPIATDKSCPQCGQ